MIHDYQMEGNARLISRADDMHEINLMRGVVRSLPLKYKAIMKVIYCDSDATAHYSVGVDTLDKEVAYDLAYDLASRFMRWAGGYNAIIIRFNIYNGSTELASLKGEWAGMTI
jgi:hypothetical protein